MRHQGLGTPNPLITSKPARSADLPLDPPPIDALGRIRDAIREFAWSVRVETGDYLLAAACSCWPAPTTTPSHAGLTSAANERYALAQHLG